MFQQYLHRALNYWLQRNQREKVLVAAAMIFLVLASLFHLYWKPINQSIVALRKTVPQERIQLAQMRVQAKQIPQYRTSSLTKSLMPTLEKSLENYGIRERLELMEPDGDNMARLKLNQVVYVDLIKWLLNLERQHGVRVHSAKLSASDTPGIVDAKVTLASGS